MHRIATLIVRLWAFLLSIILILPAGAADAAGVARAVAGPADPAGELLAAPVGYFYTVQAGDTLWDIAVGHRITIAALLAANPAADPRLLRHGDRIFVPAAAVTMAPPSPAAQSSSPIPAAVVGLALAPGSAQAPEMAGWAALLVQQMNEQRIAAGRAPLAWSEQITAAAQAHADDCLRRGWGSHIGSDGARISARLARVGYVARWAGENWAHMSDPQAAFAFWWNEPPGADPHRSNILNPLYRDVGIGIVKAAWGYYFFADFGGR